VKRVLLVSLAALLGVSAARAESLRIASSADFPPWESVDAANEIVGFDRDIGNEVCKRIGADCSWTNQAFDGLLPGLQVGKYDLIMSGLSINDEREKQVDFSAPYADAPNNIVVAAGSPVAQAKNTKALEEGLAGKVIGAQTGSTHEAVIRAHFKDADVRLYDRAEQVADDIVAGRLDAGLMERSAWEGMMASRKDSGITIAGPLITSADYAEFGRGQAIALKKGKDDLKKRIDQAVNAMLADGTVAKLSEKWFKYDVSFKKK